MPTRALRHPVSGDQLLVLVGSEESQGELFKFEYLARTSIAPPPDHVHPEQEERVEVLEGTIGCRIGGQERLLKPGEAVTIPPGVHHAVWSADPSGSRSIGEYRPALDMQRIFEEALSST